MVGIAKTLFWSKAHADFEKQLAEIEEARSEGLIRLILILPPPLNNREKTDTYLSGEASTIKDAMGVTNFVSRASMADLCLRLGQKAASGEEVPQWGRHHKTVVISPCSPKFPAVIFSASSSLKVKRRFPTAR